MFVLKQHVVLDDLCYIISDNKLKSIKVGINE